MQLDNDLLGLWLKAETLTKTEIRFLIETIQTMRKRLDVNDPSMREAACNLQELATRPVRAFRPNEYFSG